MRVVSRALLSLIVLVGPAVGTARAITLKEILDYHGKVDDDTLIALMEADASVFHLTVQDVSKLQDQGLSKRLILAMIDTARPKIARSVAPDQPAPPPLDALPPPDDAPLSSVDAPPAPVVVNVTQHVSQHVDSAPSTVEVPVPVAVPVIEHSRRPLPEPQQTPQYWGYGGQKRPDSWGSAPAPAPQRSDSKPDPNKKGGGS